MIKIKKIWNRSPKEIDELIKFTEGKEFQRNIEKMRDKHRSLKNRLFTHVNIETTSQCNNNCSFCPVSTINNQRPLVKMRHKIFVKIINDLVDLNFSGKIYPFINNEPLLDGFILDKVRYIRQKLPKATIHIETNGILLTLKLAYALFEFVDTIKINDYADNDKDYKNFTLRTRDFLKKIDKDKIKRDVDLIVCHRLKNQLLSDRSGKVEGRIISQTNVNKFCNFPFYQLNINPKGKIFVCCRDTYWEEIIGDIKENSLEEIWNNNKYNEIRDAFLNDKRICSVCRKCSSNGSMTI